MKFLGLVATLVVALAAVAVASHVNPEHYGDEPGEENNPSCAFLNSSWNEVKVNQAPNGDYPDSGGGDNPGGEGPLVFTVKNSNGEVFDWTSNIGVDAVVVKGGNRGSNVYFYDPEETADTGLRSPLNTKGNRPAVSHISACYDVEAREEEEPGQQDEEPDQPEGQGEDPAEPEQGEDEPDGSGERPGNERPAEPDEPQEGDKPEDEGNAERPADEPQDDGDTEDAEEDGAPEAEDDEDEAEGEGDVEGVSETEEGDADDVEEESAPGSSDDDSDSDDGNLPFTGAPVSPLMLVALLLLLVGTAGRAGTRD